MAEVKVKEDLSRMKGAYGEKMIKKLKNMKVAVFGLRGAGIETAKNLLLAGPHTVMVHDDELVRIEDLGCNFYLDDSDVGKPRGQASSKELADINPNTYFSVHTGEVTTSVLAEYSTVIFTDLQAQWPLSKLIEFDKFCSSKGVKFIWTGIFGMHMAVFSNFGKQHEIFDKDGAPERSIVITDIESVPAPYETIDDFLNAHIPKNIDVKKMGYSAKKEWGVKLLEEKAGLTFSDKRKKTLTVAEILDYAESNPKTLNEGKMAGKVTTEGVRHLMHSGEWLKLEEIEMDGKMSAEEGKFEYGAKINNINSTVQLKAHRTNPRIFFIGDISSCGKYVKGGIGNQKKMSVYRDYELLSEQLYKPTIEQGVQNFMKFGVASKLHVGMVALMQFHEQKGRYPAVMDEKEAKEVVDLAEKIKKENEGLQFYEVDSDLVTKMAMHSANETNAIAAIDGGFVAQEAMKQTGKYTPVNQFIHFDAFELVTGEGKAGRADRYGHYASLFGEDFVKKTHESKYFLVGCGALGCEFLKNIAMMGLGIKGKINITDDDVIELSNLSRQFLFRRKHVGCLKSESSASVACEMNPELKGGMNVYKIRVEPKTESVFNSNFWSELDFVINALDNIKARVYMDGKCILHGKTLFESGTLGTQANSSVHVPHKTPSYAQGSPPGEGQGIAMCTMTNFPYEPLHCIEWSRAMFGQMFEDGPAAYEDMRKAGVDKFLEKVDSNEAEGLTKLQSALKWAELAKSASLETCVKLAFDMFIKEYRDKVKDLIACYPEDQKDKQGLPFWRGRKRFPVPMEWDATEDVYINFIWHTACIFADILGVAKHSKNGRDGYPTKDACAKIAASLSVPEWKASSVDIEDEEEEEGKKKTPSFSADDMNLLENLKKEAKAIGDVTSLPSLEPGDFEKDDDSNHHIDWITASANLRADTRRLKRSERHHCRMVAGRIIAAIATTTASITGFIFLEVYKRLLGIDDIEKYNWNTINLATNQIISEMPADPKENYTYVKKEQMEEDNKVFTKETTIIAVPDKFTCYDFIDIKGDLTFGELVGEFKKHPMIQGGLTISGLFAGKASLYDGADVSTYEKRKKTALERAAKAKSAGHKKHFARQADNWQKFIDAIKKQDNLKVSQKYFELCGKPSDSTQPFLLLDCAVHVDPGLPAWLNSRLPKRDNTHDLEINTPSIRLWYK
mmetsp:Transcript_10787/g.19665  ORF Transcript_10787/g.19665 Transcript_10787/m.19665 type:complete len:1186 (+) Transcript_10787:88-3645(+)|eukprot:CAMPEP_0197529040 /NCGR_PEP_ID=MMETSP1318-20131121/27059_1 /TAXON_ID=552666 /ORGANISM="Partenskyella glossopodia, Strain RCC365" /LENGTH=1185 /DNA_ID=CAMNT_0043084361 /DNA_START=60 /DNA_END=3617 /DNA_ORIENTATION=+